MAGALLSLPPAGSSPNCYAMVSAGCRIEFACPNLLRAAFGTAIFTQQGDATAAAARYLNV
jgi:hypothetical protein